MRQPDRTGTRRPRLRASAGLALLVLLLAACAPSASIAHLDDVNGGGGDPAPAGDPAGAAGAPAGERSSSQPDVSGEDQGAQAARGGTANAASTGADGTARSVGAPPGEHSARTPSGAQTGTPTAADDPVGVVIPAIEVSSSLVRLGLERDRSMEVPDDFSLAGWYVHAPKPGEVGPAVIAGHVDGRRGPAVFYRLHELKPGDEVVVHRADGAAVAFVVDRVEQHPKDAFPTDDVYGNTDGPELRLITCGGDWDRRARSHRDNIIVFASATS